MDRRGFLAASAGVLVAPRALATQLGGTPVALVTADLESRVVAYDTSNGRRLRVIRTLALPRSIEEVGGDAVICHSELGAVTIVDGPNLRVRRVLRDFDEPRYVAASLNRVYAYVTDSGSGEIVVVNVPLGRIVGRVKVGGPARHIALAPDGRRVWTALGMEAAHVAIVDVRDPARPRLLRRFRPPWLAHDVGFTPGGGRIWVTSGSTRELALYDRRSGRLLRRLPAGAPPQHVTFIGGRAYVTSGDDGTLEVRSASTGAVLRTTAIPVGSFNVQRTWNRFVLTPSLSRGTLCVVDRAGRVVRQVQAARSSHDACFVVAR